MGDEFQAQGVRDGSTSGLEENSLETILFNRTYDFIERSVGVLLAPLFDGRQYHVELPIDIINRVREPACINITQLMADHVVQILLELVNLQLLSLYDFSLECKAALEADPSFFSPSSLCFELMILALQLGYFLNMLLFVS